MYFLLHEGRYCLIGCWPFDQVFWSFSDLKTRTRLLVYIKHPWNIQLNKLKSHRIDCCYLLYSSKMTLRCFLCGLRRVFSSPIITLNFQLGTRATKLVTSLGCFGHVKMAADFGLNRQTWYGWKSSFRLPYAKEKSTVFPSKVETLLLCKNLPCENFVSVAL